MNGLVTLITGGTSGLGLACAQRFAQQGALVIICGSTLSKGNEVIKEWSVKLAASVERDNEESYGQMYASERSRLQGQQREPRDIGSNVSVSVSSQSSIDQKQFQQQIPSFFCADVSNETQVQSMFEKIKQQYGRLDVVVNCAGTAVACRTYNIHKRSMHSMSDFQHILNVNLHGTFNIIRWSCHLMADNQPNDQGQRGVIINTASVAAFDGRIGQVAYAASKGAITSMTLPLARDLSNMGVRVCTIVAGVFYTSMLLQLPEKLQTSLGNMIPFPKRHGRPDEFAHLTQTIVENPYINGAVIRLDGALRMPP